MNAIRKIGVAGVGGVGGYLGGRLIQAGLQPEVEIYFVARGRHLEEIKARGLILNTPERKGMVCQPDLATDDVSKLPALDLCLVCVKGYDLAGLCARLKPVLRPETVLLPLLNGVDIYERMRAVLSSGVILRGCIYVGTHIERPGVVTQEGGDAKILFGPDPRHPRFDAAPVRALFQRAGIRHQWFKDPAPAIWEKYLFIAAFGLVTGVTGKTLGGVLADPEWLARTRGIMEEIVDLGRKKGIPWDRSAIDATLAKAMKFPPDTKTSFQRDLEQKGHPHEGELLGGTLLGLGKELGVPTPMTRRTYEEILSR